jgi:hypothetical protein
LTSDNAWEKVPEKIAAINTAARALVRAHHFHELKKSDLYSCRNLLQTTLRRIEGNTFESPEEKASLEALVAMLNTLYESM